MFGIAGILFFITRRAAVIRILVPIIPIGIVRLLCWLLRIVRMTDRSLANTGIERGRVRFVVVMPDRCVSVFTRPEMLDPCVLLARAFTIRCEIENNLAVFDRD